MKIQEKFVDASTGQETIIERDETKEETKARLDFTKKIEEAAQVEQERISNRAALLAQLGITEEQAKLLLG